MPKWKLVKDLPFQKADETEWEIEDTNQQVVRFSTSPSAYQATIFRSKEEKRLFWEESWGDPLTSGWFEEVVHERFKAKEGGIYFYVKLNQHLSSDNLVCETIETLSWEDAVNFEISNYFRTQEQAEEAAKRINKLLDEYQKEINKE